MPRRVVRASERLGGADRAVLRRRLGAIQAELGVSPDFPAPVAAEAEAAARAPRLPRLDRTDLPLVTVDPASSLDLDQALHIERRGSGYRVHYAIADVAAFVLPGGEVDREADRRGETLYGLDATVPLHPRALSEGACSLLPDGDRPALLWTLDVDGSGEGVEARVERAMVRSRAKLSYAGVQRDVDAGRAGPLFSLLREVGELRQARERLRGGVSLRLPEQEVDCAGGRCSLAFREPLPVETWNAQISLLTGMAAAWLMTRGKVGLLRTLAPADPEDVARLHRVARALRVEWADATPYPDFVRGLDPARPDHAAMLTAATSLFRGAGYVAFDGEVPERAGHAALAGEYAHVTAPLRRLVDRYAGEICLALCAGEPVPDWVLRRLQGLPATMQEAAGRAGRYERAVLDLVEAAVLRDRVGETFTGTVVQVGRDRSRGRLVVPGPAVEAPVVAADAARPLPLGAEVEARLVRADPEARVVRFEWP